MIMRNLTIIYLSILFLFTSCDDGEIIVTTFDFAEDTFSMCSDGRDKVLYHINNETVYETLSVQLSHNNFSPEENTLTLSDQPISIDLSGNNQIIYRTYDGPVPTAANAYFCGEVPPANPRVLQEYRSVGGRVIIRNSPVYSNIDGMLDHDGDGIPSAEEGMAENRDTDGDGIPDYLDVDDDGDNVLTSVERQIPQEDPTAEGYPDTDGDGIPNYLDPDDDGDGIPTRREVTADNLDPTLNRNEGNTMPRYLDRFSTEEYTGEIGNIIDNSIPVRYESLIEVENLKLKNQGGDGEEISFISITIGNFRSGQLRIPVVPD